MIPISRQVAVDEGEKLAKDNKAAWVETSAKANVNVGTFSSVFQARVPSFIMFHSQSIRTLSC